MITYEKAKEIRRGIRNPWLSEALDRVGSFCEPGYYRHVFILTVLEYSYCRNSHKPFRCADCRGEVHYKASIGGYKCVGCSKLFRSNGDPCTFTRRER